MSRIDRLIEAYKNHIHLPWSEQIAAAQRVIFCIYHESEELRLRGKIDEFDLATKGAEHEWGLFDLTNSFAQWLASQRYAESYFKKPAVLNTLLPKYLEFIETHFVYFVETNDLQDNAVVALLGAGSLFGFLKVKDVVDRLAPHVSGRLLVFFPGSYENNNYRLLDGYDGWNYLAVPVTADQTSGF